MPPFLEQECQVRAGRTKPQRQNRLKRRGAVCQPILSLRFTPSCLRKRGNASFPQAERRAGSLGLREGRPKDQRPDRSRTVRPKPQRQDRLTGSTCLYMNYSIILQKLVSIDKLQFCYK